MGTSLYDPTQNFKDKELQNPNTISSTLQNDKTYLLFSFTPKSKVP